MTRFSAFTAALPAVLIAASLGLAVPAFAEEAAAPAAQPMKVEDKEKIEGKGKGMHGKHGKPGMHHRKGGMMDPADLDKIEGMNAEERQAFFKAKREQWEKMSEEERAAARAEIKAKYEALTPEQKEALKERKKKIGEKMRAEYQKKMESMTPEEKEAYLEKIKSRRERMEKDFKRLPPEEQEKFKERLERKRGKASQPRIAPME